MSASAAAAKAYAARGWRPIRLHGVNEQGLCTCADREKPGHEKTAGKHPTDGSWQQQPPMSAEQIDAAYAGWRAGHNVGVATGRESGFWVLDVDPDNGGFESIQRLQDDYAKLPETVAQQTGSKGYHLLWQMPDDFEPTNRKGGLKDYPGLDIRGTGGQIVVAPSRSAKGPYRWLSAPDAEPSPAPDWLLDLLRPAAPTAPAAPAETAPAPRNEAEGERARLDAYTERVVGLEIDRLKAMSEAAVAQGQTYKGEPWNVSTFHVACSLLEIANSEWNTYAVQQAYTDLHTHAPRDAGFTDEDVNERWKSAVSTVGARGRPYPVERVTTEDIVAGWLDTMAEQGVRIDPRLFGSDSPPPPGLVLEQPPEPPVDKPMRSWDDLGNAMRVVDHFGTHLRWVAEAEQWAVYRKGAWRLDKPHVVQGLIQRMIDELIPATEALHYDDAPAGEEGEEPSEREQFLKWLKSQRMSARISAAQNEARGRTALQARMGDFDDHPMLLNCLNGVVDLRTGELLPHDPALMLSKQVAVEYDPSATAPLWHRFLERVQPDPEMRDYVQRVLGYSITGSTEEQAYFLWHGDGANGKSVVAGVVSRILGSYGGAVAPGTLMASGQETHPTGWAAMAGARWLPATETAPGKRLEEEKIKEFTGGQPIAARFMAKDFFEYVPVGKIHIISNHLPLLSAQESIWRRTYLIKWGVTIPAAEQDRKLEQKLQGELPGVLAWLVAGARSWADRGLSMPAAAAADLADYRGDSDLFGDFLRDCTVPASVDTKTPVRVLFEAYTTWAFGQNVKAMSMPSFVAAMTERKYERYRDSSARGFRGIAVSKPAPALADPWTNVFAS